MDWSAFAVVLIDVQRDFWTEEMTEVFPNFHENVERLLASSRESGIDVVHLRAKFKADRSDWMVRYRMGSNIPCIEGTPGVEIFPCAGAVDGETVIEKQTFDGFLQPDFAQYLEQNGKRFLLLAGLVTSVCVLTTAAAAAQRGYLVALVDDCCADLPLGHTFTLERYPFIFTRTTSKTFLAEHESWHSQLKAL